MHVAMCMHECVMNVDICMYLFYSYSQLAIEPTLLFIMHTVISLV